MLTRRLGVVISFIGAVAMTACGGGSSEPSGGNGGPSSVDIISGNGQVQLIGSSLPKPLTVKVTAAGSAVKGATVTFAVVTGSATVNPSSAVTDASGQASTQVTLGSAPGDVTIAASVNGTSLKVNFLETAGASTITPACSAGSGTSLAVGEVRAGLSGSGICITGASGAEYGLIAFYGNTDSSATTSIGVTAKGAAAVTVASRAPSADETLMSAFEHRPENKFQVAFERDLRERARRELTPKIPAAQEFYRHRPNFSAIPANPAIGTLVQLNANGQVNCANPITITARVAAVSTTAIVVADTANPAGGFTDAEYASFATMFDTLVRPVDVQNFGEPSDVDKNGKTIIFFTKEVNKLTPRGSSGFIGGFFYERDLFPTQNTSDLQGCPTSNFAEMYYALVPDGGAKYGDARSKQSVLDLTPSTLAHEFQHLINAGRRLYVNNAEDFEQVWLNEGLSHIAEELLYYRVAKLAPRQNINTSTVTATTASINAFNNYIGDNIGRFEIFIGMPNATSVYAGNDELETRGATWHMLRYLADHRGSSDADTWSLLVNSKTTGHHNLANVFGADYMTQIRDWATSLFSDDVNGVTDARFLEPSWNMRSIFPSLVNSANRPLGRYPLAIIPVSDASGGNASIQAGGAAFFRFGVSSGNASIDWSSAGLPVTGLVKFTLVRTK
jgi:hypothetical protein